MRELKHELFDKIKTLIHSLNRLHTSPTFLSTLWTCCTQVQHPYPLSEPVAHNSNIPIHPLNLLHTSPTSLFTLWTCCRQVQQSCPLSEPIAHKSSTPIHSLILFHTHPTPLFTSQNGSFKIIYKTSSINVHYALANLIQILFNFSALSRTYLKVTAGHFYIFHCLIAISTSNQTLTSTI